MCGVDGSIRTSTLAQLKRLDPAFNSVPGEVDAAGPDPTEYVLRGQGPDDPDPQIPELPEVLETFRTVPLNLELKAPGFEADLSLMLRDYGRGDDVIVVSFSDSRVSKFRVAQPTIGDVALPPEIGPPHPMTGVRWTDDRGPVTVNRARPYPIGLFWIASRFGAALENKVHVAMQMPDRKYGVHFSDRRLVAAAHKRELAVHVWTVDNVDRMNTAIDDGVDGIMTDRPFGAGRRALRARRRLDAVDVGPRPEGG